MNYICAFPNLAGSWNSNCAGPVVVQVSHLVSDELNAVNGKTRRVVKDDVVRRRDSSLADVLAYEEEVGP